MNKNVSNKTKFVVAAALSTAVLSLSAQGYSIHKRGISESAELNAIVFNSASFSISEFVAKPDSKAAVRAVDALRSVERAAELRLAREPAYNVDALRSLLAQLRQRDLAALFPARQDCGNAPADVCWNELVLTDRATLDAASLERIKSAVDSAELRAALAAATGDLLSLAFNN